MATNKHDRIEKLLDVLGSGLYEKETAVKLGLLTALAGESMFMLGAPGCAKSMITRRIKEAFKADDKDGVKYFETLLNQFITPEEVFGNISLKALNGQFIDENGKKIEKEEYRRLTEGMLPEADIAFLDEIWKASPAILNTLLTIVNERKFHNGSKVMNVPLKALFAASNELPAKGKGLEALYDRFIFRLPVDFIKNEDDFFEMIDQPAHEEFKLNEEDKKLLISNTELKEWAKEIDKVTLSEVSKQVISAIRKEMTLLNDAMSDEDKKNGELFEVGDRRWKKIAHILKTSAFLNDRNEVDLMDCSLIENCIWGTEKQQKKAKEIVEKCLKENGIPCDSAIEDIQEQIEEFTAKVDEEWFETITDPVSDKIVSVDNQKCYECTRNGTREIWYVTVDKGRHSPYNGYHDVYNSAKTHQSYSNFSKNGDAIACNWNFTVNKNPEKTHIEPKKFADISHSTLQKIFTKNNYTPISNFINSEIDKLKDQKAKDAVPFKANLFADQSYNTSITSKIDDSIKDLEDKQVELDKQKDRYYSDDLEPELSVGDVILNDGSIFTAKEIKNLSDEQKENVIAVVCIADESKYAIGVNQYSKKWTEMKHCCSDYSTKVADDYSKGWIVPKIELLQKIWENRDVINKSLKAVSGETLDGKEYWSYSETEDKSAAMYMTFDDRGHQDHTTKDHEYTICVIRDWRNF
ncbi:MAG: AAA family ATPase [Treponema sp.]|nr:AAA family ATPase [Treponema sp.]MBQ6056695.1 AAA family ATPase [Treponema sp.]MBR0486928.1 AAA family ATPase [Treponema sp.]